MDTDVRQRLGYGWRAFQAGDGSWAFERGYQAGRCSCRACRSETAPSEMLRNNLGASHKTTRYPYGQPASSAGNKPRA